VTNPSSTQQPRLKRVPSEVPRSGLKTRRRGSVLEDALLQAAWEELWATGYAGFTMEGAAARAGTSKAVLYRRWPNRAQLALAALRNGVTPLASQVPDTGNLREDILGVLRSARDRAQDFGPDMVYGLLAAVDDLPPDVFELIPSVTTTILSRAAARGEIPARQIPSLVASLPIALLRQQVLLRKPIPDSFLAEIVDDVFLPLVGFPQQGS
jgi:AcrR family transcriptional regulator